MNNFKEIFQALLDGKKLKFKNWSGVERYFYINEEGDLIYKNNNKSEIVDSFNFINFKDIEEYKENYVSFVEVMEHLKKGKSAKRKDWKGKIFFDSTAFNYNGCLIYVFYDISKESIPFKIYPDDMYANDWILL
jgi:hypothetical protein